MFTLEKTQEIYRVILSKFLSNHIVFGAIMLYNYFVCLKIVLFSNLLFGILNNIRRYSNE